MWEVRFINQPTLFRAENKINGLINRPCLLFPCILIMPYNHLKFLHILQMLNFKKLNALTE